MATTTNTQRVRTYPAEVTKALRNSTEGLRLSARGMARAALAAGTADEQTAGKQAARIGGEVRRAFLDEWRLVKRQQQGGAQ